MCQLYNKCVIEIYEYHRGKAERQKGNEDIG